MNPTSGLLVTWFRKHWEFSKVLLVTPAPFSELSEACFAAVRNLYLYDTAKNRKKAVHKRAATTVFT